MQNALKNQKESLKIKEKGAQVRWSWLIYGDLTLVEPSMCNLHHTGHGTYIPLLWFNISI